MGTKLPRKIGVQKMLLIVGEQIPKWLAHTTKESEGVAQVAERATCSPLTVSRMKKGANRSHRNLLACVVCFAT